MPFMSIRKEAPHGGNIKIKWEEPSDKKDGEACFGLYRGSPPASEKQEVQATKHETDMTDTDNGNNAKRPRTDSSGND